MTLSIALATPPLLRAQEAPASAPTTNETQPAKPAETPAAKTPTAESAPSAEGADESAPEAPAPEITNDKVVADFSAALDQWADQIKAQEEASPTR
ncbi:hypothetical protein AUC71_16630 [Methyloceanibacter marginalis]|uniref:Uncharacterized protein n=1 Tax=Methyloceanibacter marginalis TaxID=1774971 RepID=A0A1E3W8P3_9HYPH|nr:hypothetical protein [Methyloceanibacter marginalis]ODS02183.1 hypothetical protein AUC71_16630 [Methyloceanibacter marginalis]